MKPIMLCLCLAFGSLAMAQDEAREEKLALAHEIMDLTQSKAMMKQSAFTLLDGFSSNEKVDEEFLNKFKKRILASSDDLIDSIAGVYADTYTLEELKGLVKFYKSDLGQAFMEHMPEVMQKSMELGQAWGQKMSQEIMAAMEQ